MYDYNHCPDRRHTDSIKWDAAGEGVLPMWVADMDIPVADAVCRIRCLAILILKKNI